MGPSGTVCQSLQGVLSFVASLLRNPPQFSWRAPHRAPGSRPSHLPHAATSRRQVQGQPSAGRSGPRHVAACRGLAARRAALGAGEVAVRSGRGRGGPTGPLGSASACGSRACACPVEGQTHQTCGAHQGLGGEPVLPQETWSAEPTGVGRARCRHRKCPASPRGGAQGPGDVLCRHSKPRGWLYACQGAPTLVSCPLSLQPVWIQT